MPPAARFLGKKLGKNLQQYFIEIVAISGLNTVRILT